MSTANFNFFRLILAAFAAITLSAGSLEANANATQTIQISEIKKPDLVEIRPSIIDGLNVDIIKIGNLPEFAVRAELADTSFTQADKEKLSRIRRDILDKTVTGLVLGASELPMLIDDDKVIKAKNVIAATEVQVDLFDSLRAGIQIKRAEGETALITKKRKTLREGAAAAVGFLNENILASTYRAGKGFVSDSKGTKGFREFGISLVFRGELQIGAGKTNIMKTIARGLDIGYDIKSKELVIRTTKRHEKMDGGTAMALGPKMELRAYRANLDVQEHLSGEGHVHGKTWYPPAPPLLTFASESFPGYHSVGTALAFNVFDVVVPTYLFNTVNEFDADYQVRRISLRPSSLARLTVAAVRNFFTTRVENFARVAVGARPSANQCRAIFSRSF